MSCQNDKNAFHINALTRLNDDYTEKESKIRNNHTIANYQYFRPKAVNRNNYLDSVTRVGIYQNNNRDGRGQMVDNESGLLNGKRGNTLTSTGKKSGKQLPTRVFPGAPFLGSGHSTLQNVDVKSELMSGLQTSTAKSTGALAGVTINRFIPLLPCIRDNIQDPNHIVPTFWVNGGESTRNVVNNVDYLKRCSLSQIQRPEFPNQQ